MQMRWPSGLRVSTPRKRKKPGDKLSLKDSLPSLQLVDGLREVYALPKQINLFQGSFIKLMEPSLSWPFHSLPTAG